MKIKNVIVAGAGILGSQISWQTAFKGFKVVVYGPSQRGIERCKIAQQKYADLFVKTKGVPKEEIEAAFSRLSYTNDLAEAVKNADLLSESIPEDIEIKRDFYQKVGKLAPKKTIFTTNSSSTLPSDYADYTGRPEKFLGLHFANGIWNTNVAEIMGHPRTSPEVIETVTQFAEQIGMIPISVHKEQNGYVLNTLLIPLLNNAVDLLVKGVSEIEDIDKAWKIGTKAPIGPLAMIDVIGMQTMYNVSQLWGTKLSDQTALNRAKFIKENYIDKGKLGMSSGEGFYKYDKK